MPMLRLFGHSGFLGTYAGYAIPAWVGCNLLKALPYGHVSLALTLAGRVVLLVVDAPSKRLLPASRSIFGNR